MATCKDCIHYEACDNADLSEYVSEEEMKVSCPHFKNKAEFVEVKHREWVPTNDDNKKLCSRCDVIHFIAQYPDGQANYCPNCGAKMDRQ